MKSLAAFSACVLCLAFVQAGDQKGFDASKLLGGWTYIAGSRNGEKIPQEHLKGVVKFDKTQVVVPGEGGEAFVMSYTVDGSKSPVAIDLKIDKAPIKEAVGSKALGIIVLDGDSLKLCYVEGNTRPTSFDSTKDNKYHSFSLKRAAK